MFKIFFSLQDYRQHEEKSSCLLCLLTCLLAVWFKIDSTNCTKILRSRLMYDTSEEGLRPNMLVFNMQVDASNFKELFLHYNPTIIK